MAAIVCIVAIILFLVFFPKRKNGGVKKADKLKDKYHQSLLGTSRRIALETGRAYYKALRGKDKALSLHDEQAIANDVSRMQTPP